MARRFGLALDNVVAVVFWGVRGGGGNFGVVTSFEFQLHPIPHQVYGGDKIYPLSRARELLKLYADYSENAPDDLYIDFSMGIPPGGGDGFAILHTCYSGPTSGIDRAYQAFKALGTPASDLVKPVEYVDIQRSGGGLDSGLGGQAGDRAGQGQKQGNQGSRGRAHLGSGVRVDDAPT